MSRKITFPAVKGTNVRRNAETGIEITNDGPDGFSVRTFHIDKRDMYQSFPTLAEARAAATEQVHLFREVIAADYVEAHTEYALRIATVLDETREAAEQHEATIVGVVHNSAVHSLRAALEYPGALGGQGKGMCGFLRAAAERTDRLVNLLSGAEQVVTDEQSAAALAEARERFPVGTAVHSAKHGEDAVVDREALVAAETGRVFVGLRFARGYGSADIDEIELPRIPVEAKPEPAPVKYDDVYHDAEVVLAADATYRPDAPAGAVYRTDYRATPERTPGGRLMIQVFRSYEDPVKGMCTAAPTVWLDELRMLDGRRIEA